MAWTDTHWACGSCGWEWPLASAPPAEAECDACGDELIAAEPPGGRGADPQQSIITPVAGALPAIRCPIDGRHHTAGSGPLQRCAAALETQGYPGYSYYRERWVMKGSA